MKRPKVTYRKYRGDDTLSWAVFIEGNPTPVDTGLSQAEARATKVTVEKMLEERERATVETFRGGAL